MQGEQYEYHFHHALLQEPEVYLANKARRLKLLSHSLETRSRVYKDVIIVSTGNVEYELDDLANMVDTLRNGLSSRFSAIICDSRATNRYLFMTHDQVPKTIDELNSIIEICQNYLLEHTGGWNGIEVQNSANVRISTYKPAWHEDPFSLMRASDFNLDRTAAEHREMVAIRHQSTVLPPPKSGPGAIR